MPLPSFTFKMRNDYGHGIWINGLINCSASFSSKTISLALLGQEVERKFIPGAQLADTLKYRADNKHTSSREQ
jgi:hypothetical protein